MPRLVVRQNQVRSIADQQVFWGDRHTFCCQSVNLACDGDGVQNDSISDNAFCSRSQNAGGDEVKDVFGASDNDGVAGVIPALAAYDDFSSFGKEIDDFAFAFIAPLSAY